MPPAHPPCCVCRNGTYATVSLQTHDDPEWEWTHYCDPCGEAMASVIRDGYQKRDPEKRRLPEPPAQAPTPPKEPKAPKKKSVAPEQPPPAPPPEKPVASRPRAKPAPSEGHDLLALLGMK